MARASASATSVYSTSRNDIGITQAEYTENGGQEAGRHFLIPVQNQGLFHEIIYDYSVDRLFAVGGSHLIFVNLSHLER